MSSSRPDTPLVTMFPNPADKSVVIATEGKGYVLDITITHISGQQVKAISGRASPHVVILVSDLLPGVYFVTITLPEGKTTKKLVIHH